MYTVNVINQGQKNVLHESDADTLLKLNSGKINSEVNAIPSFSFSISALNPNYDKLTDRKTIVEVQNGLTEENDFEGVMVHSKERVSASGTIDKLCTCEGFMTYLNESVQPYHHYESENVTSFLSSLLANHNSLVSADKHIQLGSISISGDNSHSKTTAYRSTLEEIKVNLIDRLGGEIQVRKTNNGLVLDYLDRIGYVSSTTIELAKNIQTIAIDTDTSNIVTRLVPLGASINDETAERLTIGEVNQGRDYIDDTAAITKYGIIMGTVVFDDITTAEALKNKAVAYLQNNNRLRKGYTAQVLDLSLLDAPDNNKCIRAGNIYHFKHPLISLDEELRVLKVQIDIFKPYKPTVEIGDKSETITSIANDTAALLEYELPKQKIDILTSAKATATALINAATNGYVVVNPNEILIMDAPDKQYATKVWRWNSNGFGYSNTGYNGTYTTAITINGAIVADFITAGVLRGLEIINGSNTFHVDTSGHVDAASINITGGSINIQTDESSTDVIKLQYSNSNQSVKQKIIISPAAVVLEDGPDGGTKRSVLIGALGIATNNGSGNQTFSITTSNGTINTQGDIYAGGTIHGNTVSASGDISAGGKVDAEQLRYKKDGSWYNVQTLIDALWNKVFGGVS